MAYPQAIHRLTRSKKTRPGVLRDGPSNLESCQRRRMFAADGYTIAS